MMPLINVPASREALKQRTRSDIQQALFEANPFVEEEYLDGIAKGLDGRILEFYQSQQIVADNLFPNTATDEWLEGWADFRKISRKAAPAARGNIVITGNSGVVVPVNTEFVVNGNIYLSEVAASTSAQTFSVVSMVRAGNTVTVTTGNNHNLASGIQGIIAGAVETDYNGLRTITVIAANQFTFTVDTTPTTPATGTITFSLNFVSVPIISTDFGQDTNLIAGTQLNFVTPIAGLNNEVYVNVNAVGGGADRETNNALRERVKEAFAFPQAYWNKNYIIATLKQISGITRVFTVEPGEFTRTLTVTSLSSDANGVATAVTATTPTDFSGATKISVSGANESQFNLTVRAFQRPDGAFVYPLPSAGAATASGTITLSYSTVEPGVTLAYFLRDNDSNPIPDGIEVNQAKDLLLERKPVNIYSDDVQILPPVAVPATFTFTALSPNTATMQAAINANLQQLFDENTAVSQSLIEDAYRSTIFNTLDSTTGQRVVSYTLSSPTGDIVAESGEIPVLSGTPTYPP